MATSTVDQSWCIKINKMNEGEHDGPKNKSKKRDRVQIMWHYEALFIKRVQNR